jgi:hypothetical protein
MNLLLEFIDFFFWFMLSYMVSQIVLNLFLLWFAGYLEKKLPVVVREQENREVLARLEVVEDQFFLYNNETNQFLGQGSTVQKLKDHITSRFPDRDVKIVAGKKTECELLKRELEQLDANRSNV